MGGIGSEQGMQVGSLILCEPSENGESSEIVNWWEDQVKQVNPVIKVTKLIKQVLSIDKAYQNVKLCQEQGHIVT